MKEMKINYRVIYKNNKGEYEKESFHTIECAKSFAERTNGVVYAVK